MFVVSRALPPLGWATALQHNRGEAPGQSPDRPSPNTTLIGRRRGVYRVLFTVGDKTVTIHRVRHADQDRLIRGEV
jgi:hypothetical protein